MTYRHRFSTKEIDLARSCLRKWAAKYLHRLPDPKHPKMQEGIDMHDLLRRMVVRGVQENTAPESKVGAWARALYPETPSGAATEVDGEFELFGYPTQYHIDWMAPGFATFGDWKSTAGPQWALTSLENDLQANLEAYGLMVNFKRDELLARWLYVDKKTCKTWRVERLMQKAACLAYLEREALPWMQVIAQMRALQPPYPPVQAVPHEPVACEGRGHFCAFLGQCQFIPAVVTVEQVLKASRPKA